MSFEIPRSLRFAALLLVLGAYEVRAQPPGGFASGTDIQFNAGQHIQPIFDGWTRNADGSFQLHFGYLNRNYVEQIHVPIGPANTIEPDGPDRGQPTYFYTRFNRRIFSVKVPSDFGTKREIVWSLTVRGKTERAIGWLQPEWEIEGSAGTAKANANAAPSITVASPSSAALSVPLSLTAKVTDDGLPKPGKPRVGGNSENPPAFRPEASSSAPVNLPQLQRPPRSRMTGLSVSWRVWRGPAAVRFDPAVVPVKDGQATTAATFSAPGEYVLRAVANDSAATTPHDIKVVVPAAARP